MGMIDRWVRNHCCGLTKSRDERRRISERQAIKRKFDSGSSVKECIRKHYADSTILVANARMGKKHIIVLDRYNYPENMAVSGRDKISMYYDQYTQEAQAFVYDEEGGLDG